MADYWVLYSLYPEWGGWSLAVTSQGSVYTNCICFCSTVFCMKAISIPVEVCIACEWIVISNCREFLLKFPDCYKFYKGCTVAFEWFVYSLKEDPHKKKSCVCQAFLSRKYQQIVHFRHNFQFQENLYFVTEEGVPLNLSVCWPAVGRSSMAKQGGDKRKDGLVQGSNRHNPQLEELRVT